MIAFGMDVFCAGGLLLHISYFAETMRLLLRRARDAWVLNGTGRLRRPSQGCHHPSEIAAAVR